MKQLKGDFTGSSHNGLSEAIAIAKAKAESASHFEVVETRSSKYDDEKRLYQVIITAFFA